MQRKVLIRFVSWKTNEDVTVIQIKDDGLD